MNSLKSSELILNADGSIYHLNLLPEDLAPTVITVGDPNRVELVSNCFDTIELKKASREFITHTGTYKGHRISVISTGIGPDNIDIVFNELDALVNVDFKTRKVKDKLTSLNIIRIGTTGSIDEAIAVDSFLVSQSAIGFDQTLKFYMDDEVAFIEDFRAQTGLTALAPYFVEAHKELLDWFSSPEFKRGITATFVGFYGPQGRELRIKSNYPNFIDQLMNYRLNQQSVSNLEMETAAIYAFAQLMGHRAVSLNCVLAHRNNGVFSNQPQERIKVLITRTLETIASNL